MGRERACVHRTLSKDGKGGSWEGKDECEKMGAGRSGVCGCGRGVRASACEWGTLES